MNEGTNICRLCGLRKEMLQDESICRDYLNKKQATPGAGEGERWEKRWSFRILRWIVEDCGKAGRIVATCTDEADADLICTLHNTREADQQTIADLRAERDNWIDRLNRAESSTDADRERVITWQAQTIAELRKALEVSGKAAQAYKIAYDAFITVARDQASAMDEVLALVDKPPHVATAIEEAIASLGTSLQPADKALAAIAATEEGKS